MGILHRPFSTWGVQFAPLLVPWKRRLETLAVTQFVFVWLILPLMSVWIPIYFLLFTPFWPIVLAYFVFMMFDHRTPAIGGRRMTWYQNLSMWTHFRDYFPIRLVKCGELSPKRNYILGSHPHGVLSVGIFSNLLTTANKFKESFPGMDPCVLTLNGQFRFPLRRDIGLASGGVESSHKSLQFLLKNPGKGRVIAIVIGGAAEALDAVPGKHNLCLKERRGFCKYALKYGADLVPVYNFGENDLYDQTESEEPSRLRTVQTKIKNAIGFCPPLMKGRGIFNYSFGLLPHRRPVTTVIGKPILVKKSIGEPTRREVDHLHSKYCGKLMELFEEHKHTHGISDHVHLNIY